MAVCYLNGEWQPIEEARVSVLDRGFMFGDGVYEVIPVYQLRAFLLCEHLDRLDNSLTEICIKNPLGRQQWLALVDEAISRGDEYYALVYIQVTRGVAVKRDHVWPVEAKPTLLITVSEAPALARSFGPGGVKAYSMITMDDYRWSKGYIKSTNLLAAGLYKNEALSQGVDDAILVRDGFITESSSSNVFVVIDDVLVTPSTNDSILHGISRLIVLTLAGEIGIQVEERNLAMAELESVSEVMVSSSGREVWPVTEVDGKAIGNGEPGAVWRRLDAAFQDYKKKLLDL